MKTLMMIMPVMTHTSSEELSSPPNSMGISAISMPVFLSFGLYAEGVEGGR